MLKETEFDKAYDVVWEFGNFIKSISDDSSLAWNLYDTMKANGFELDSFLDMDDMVWFIMLRDALACYFALGFPQEYISYRYEAFNLLCYSYYSKGEWILYDDYCDFTSLQEQTSYYKKMFDSTKGLASNNFDHPTLYILLNKISVFDGQRYIEIIQRFVKLIAQNGFITNQGRKWMDELFRNPKQFANISSQQEEYELKTEEFHVDSISRELYNMTERVTEELFCFIKDNLYNSIPLLRAFKSDSVIGQVITDFDALETFTNLFVTKDLCECYKKLNHSIDIDTLEGKVLFMFLMKTNHIEHDYDKFNECCNRNSVYQDVNQVRENCVQLLRMSYEFEVGADFEFNMPFYLKQVDSDLSKKYMIILYRCASVIAKADGIITEDESNWLSSIMKQEGINEEHTNERFEIVTKTSNESNPIAELESLIGLDTVKKDVVSLANFIKMKQMREAKGLKAPNISYHCVFTGNPGTGKTTVARVLAEIFKDLGILKSGHLVETDRSGLVAEYVGQTAIKTNKIIDSAIDGVLFIDEAYTLVGGDNDYGKEAIATLLKRMEDDRDRLIVILAGYTHEMEDFINSNPGLRSRFNRYIFFPDYSSAELFDIFQLNVKKNEYHINEDVIQYLKSKFESVVKNKQKDFGNARFVRNYFELAIEHQANRLASEIDLTAEKLSELTIDDIDILE